MLVVYLVAIALSNTGKEEKHEMTAPSLTSCEFMSDAWNTKAPEPLFVTSWCEVRREV